MDDFMAEFFADMTSPEISIPSPSPVYTLDDSLPLATYIPPPTTTSSSLLCFADVESKFMSVMAMTMQTTQAMGQTINKIATTQEDQSRTIAALSAKLDDMSKRIESGRSESVAITASAIVEADRFRDVDPSLVLWCLLNLSLDTKAGIDFLEFDGDSVFLFSDFFYKMLISSHVFGSAHRFANRGSGAMKSYSMFRVALQQLGFGFASKRDTEAASSRGPWVPLTDTHKQSNVMVIDAGVFAKMLLSFKSSPQSTSVSLPDAVIKRAPDAHKMTNAARVLAGALSIVKRKSGGYIKDAKDGRRVFAEEWHHLDFTEAFGRFASSMCGNDPVTHPRDYGRHITLGFTDSLEIATRKRKR